MRESTLFLIVGRALSATALVVVLGACSMVPDRPDLVRLYETQRTDVSQPPVILIPGLMGSQLARESGEEIWIGSIWKLLLSDYREAALRIDPETLMPVNDGVRATGITSRFAGREFYSAILDTLETAGGYTRARPGEPPNDGDRHYYVFAYDWRQDNVHTVRRLHEFIEQIRSDHRDPDLQVDIIAHSMGGMIARYYLRYGTVDVTEDNRFPVNYHGEGVIRRIALLGTPNLGSVESLKAFIVGRRIGLRTIPPEVLMTFPSFYQLFPHPLNDWLIDVDGRPVDRDPFDISTWRHYRWSVFDPNLRERIQARYDQDEEAKARLSLLERYFHKHIERGRRFMWSLTVNLEREPWQLVVMGGACHLTPARMVVESSATGHELHLTPDDIDQPRPGVEYDRLMLEPGDGTVTKASLLARESLDPFVPRHKWSHFPIAYPVFLCEEHGRLTNNAEFQDNLLNLLLSRDRR